MRMHHAPLIALSSVRSFYISADVVPHRTFCDFIHPIARGPVDGGFPARCRARQEVPKQLQACAPGGLASLQAKSGVQSAQARFPSQYSTSKASSRTRRRDKR